MSKLFTFNEPIEIPTEEPVDMSPNAIEYYTELEGIQSNINTSFSSNLSRLERINSKFDTTNSLISNLREYGINPQMASYIKDNYSSNTINLLINDTDSLQYGKNTKLANEVSRALEAINWRQLKDDLLNFLRTLWDKFITFIKPYLERGKLGIRINQACRRYKNLQQYEKFDDNKISSVEFHKYNGIPKKAMMNKFVNDIQTRVYTGLSKYKLQSEDISYIENKTLEILAEFNNYRDWILTDNGGYEKSKVNIIKYTDIKYSDLISDRSDSFRSIAFDSVNWIFTYSTKTFKLLELNKNLIESYINSLDENDVSKINEINSCRNTLLNYTKIIQILQLVISKNIEIINTYCTLLNNMG